MDVGYDVVTKARSGRILFSLRQTGLNGRQKWTKAEQVGLRVLITGQVRVLAVSIDLVPSHMGTEQANESSTYHALRMESPGPPGSRWRMFEDHA